MDALIRAIKSARYVFVCGNGGSAATAEHLTNDLFSVGVKAFCLSSNVSILTMLANDFGYHRVFSDQLYRYAGPEDLLITISCSGTSPNIENALCAATVLKMKMYEFEKGANYEKTEDKHMQFVHELKKRLKK